MIFHRKRLVLGVVLILAATIWGVAASNLVDQTGVLAGRVIAQDLATAGMMVKEGTVLMRVESITGSAVAARATRDGAVREVLVKPGDMVKVGQVIARIEPAVK
jgi:multidrug efflux pump subunit AcrA (membrane-fusion protein)